MKFLEIKRDGRTGKVISHRMVERDDLRKEHPHISELMAWADGARPRSRFSLSTVSNRFSYIRVDSYVEKDIAIIIKDIDSI